LIRNFATYHTLTTSRKHFEYSHYIVLEKHNLLSSTDFGRKELSTLGNCCIVEEQAEHYISVVKKTRKVVYSKVQTPIFDKKSKNYIYDLIMKALSCLLSL